MSDLVSALNGASFEGFAHVEEQGLRGMITLRGDLASAEMAEAVKAATAQTLPGQRQIVGDDKALVAWMSPDELLILCDYAAVAKTIATLEIGLAGRHFMAVDVSDARALFRVSGAGAREVLAKLAPVDFSPLAFEPGQLRRSRLAQVPAAMWMQDADAINLICFRAVAHYVMGVLRLAANEGGEVGVFT